MALGLDAIKNDLSEGARANKYKITITRLETKVESLAKAASLPGHTIGQAEVYSQGRKVPLAGDTTYDTWDCTFYNDVDMTINKLVHKWMKSIDDFSGNTSEQAKLGDYKGTVEIVQLDRQGNEKATYTLENAWPTTVSEVSLGADSNDQVSEVTVTFAYSHYEIA